MFKMARITRTVFGLLLISSTSMASFNNADLCELKVRKALADQIGTIQGTSINDSVAVATNYNWPKQADSALMVYTATRMEEVDGVRMSVAYINPVLIRNYKGAIGEMPNCELLPAQRVMIDRPASDK